MKELTEQQVIDAVDKYLKDHHPGGADLKTLAHGIRHEQEWWYVPVRPSVQPSKRYEYYEALAEVENEMQKSEGITVLLVPTALEAEPAATS